MDKDIFSLDPRFKECIVYWDIVRRTGRFDTCLERRLLAVVRTVRSFSAPSHGQGGRLYSKLTLMDV